MRVVIQRQVLEFELEASCSNSWFVYIAGYSHSSFIGNIYKEDGAYCFNANSIYGRGYNSKTTALKAMYIAWQG